ncbi:transcription termination/antitermination protein NusG [Acidicapsa acidisoli]|uniref:transcription termination/antitermination protein NusG n=1 Tax=Acidicapsa acidisoli TaxID=1615681 RepID=UPI0021DF9896|nr:transcription termination/antitermination NusG family protein [Acidicapsa acidisoli]
MHSDPWHVLHVVSNHEKLVAQHLGVRSLEHYLPLYTERVKWTDRIVVAERPLFPGYLFVRFLPQSRRSVISTPGVLRVLGDDESNMVSCAELDQICIGLASGLLLRPHPRVTVGTQVRVRNGVFAGVEGLVTELRQQSKVILTLSAVTQCFSLEVELGDIEVVNKAVAKPGLLRSAAYS